MLLYNSKPYRVFTVFNYILLGALVVLSILPFLHIIAISLSAAAPANANEVGLLPVGLTLDSYKEAFSDESIYRPFINSIVRVFVGVSINMVVVVLLAYPLSKDSTNFPGRKYYTWFIIFTMLFSGGMIPMYVLVRNLKMMDSIWALVLPAAVPVFNVIVLLNFFRQLPQEIEEAAFIDGAGYVRALLHIFLPLSVPSLATLTLFAAINHWNAWFDGMIYMKDPLHYPLSTYLQVMVTRLREITSFQDAEYMMRISQRGLLMAYIVLSIAPIAVVYPFLQKHIRTGLVLGSVKG